MEQEQEPKAPSVHLLSCPHPGAGAMAEYLMVHPSAIHDQDVQGRLCAACAGHLVGVLTQLSRGELPVLVPKDWHA